MIKSKFKWLKKESNYDNNLKDVLPKELLQILYNRGIDTNEKLDMFLLCDMTLAHDPDIICDIKKAATSILDAVINNEKICVYGDYDVDGITSTTIMLTILNALGADTMFYIPNRLTEGYGMNESAIKEISKKGANLIITVDTGITAMEEAKLVSSLGMKLVITDHHEMIDHVPEADLLLAVVDLKRGEDEYPFRELAGCGIAFKVCEVMKEIVKSDNKYLSLKDSMKDFDENRLLELVALGTIADIVPLVDENRIFVKEGLKLLETTDRIGLRLLIESTIGMDYKNLKAKDVAFNLVPKMNAAGRMSDASICIDLLMEEDETVAAGLVRKLIANNDARKRAEGEIYKQVVDIICGDERYQNENILLVKGKGWNHGIVGIVAARIAEEFFKPVVIFNEEDGELTGSARSFGGVNIFNILSSGKDILTKFGGHEKAAGLSLKEENFEELRTKINEYADEVITKDMLVQRKEADLEISIDDIDLDFVKTISRLEPFGEANEEPKFIIKGNVYNSSLMGKTNNHLKLKLKGEYNSCDAVAFFRGDLYEQIITEKDYEILGSLGVNEFLGKESVQIMLEDIKNSYEDIASYYFDKSLCKKVKEHIDVFDEDEKELEINKEIIKNFDEAYEDMVNSSPEELSKKVYIINNRQDLIHMIGTENDFIRIYEGEMPVPEALKIGEKHANIVVNNLTKIIDLRKNNTIIYIDSLYNEMSVSKEAQIGVNRDEVVHVYKRITYLSKLNKSEIYLDDLSYNLRDLDNYRILISLEILRELGILEFSINDDELITFKINHEVKNPIDNSEIYKSIRKA